MSMNNMQSSSAAEHTDRGAEISSQITLRDKIGYMFGDFGNDFFFVSIGTFLTVFYTDVMGIEGAVIGLIFLAARVWDAFTDVMMGQIVDNVRPAKDGKYKCWIRRMAVPLCISGVICFYPFTDVSLSGRITYAVITYILYGMMYTAVNIPYGSMASVMSNDPADRAALSTFRNVGSSISSAFVNFLIPMVVFTAVVMPDGSIVQKADGNRFFWIMVAFACAAFVCYMLCVRLCTERIRPKYLNKEERAKLGGLKTTFKGFAHNKPLLVLIATAIILLTSQTVVNSLNTYVYKDYFKDSTMLAYAGLLMTACTFIVAPFVAPLVRRYGKKETVAAAAFSSACLYLLLGFIHVESVGLYFALSFLATFGAAYFNTIIWAVVLDVIDYQEYITHKRDDATVYAMYSFSRKIGQAVAGGLSGLSLTLVGYVSSTGGSAVQTEETCNNIYNVATFVPGCTYLVIALIMAFIYPISKKKAMELAGVLKARHACELN